MIHFKTPLMLLVAGSFALTGCIQPSPEPQNGNTRTQNGALIGAGLGALLGATKESGSDRFKNAAIGAALGAGLGAIIGNQMDKQAAELRNSMGNDVKIVNTGDRLVVTMPQDILFDTDSALVRGGLRSDLHTLAANLQKYPDTTIDVLGHTDNTGAAEYNQNLSSRRASAVANVLMNAGVRPSRVRSFGRGEDEPVSSNQTTAGRQQNRRVEIVIRPAS
ncbi:membrane protein [Marinosulfonomonas sp. PRT-SC04]|nr:membrane protein [Marinosulfonomonas sp. PRT-SC04]